MYCPKCRVTMKGDAQGFYKCVICGHVAHDLVNRVTKSASDDDAAQTAAAPLLNALAALSQLPAALARIATALEDRAAPSPLDALRAAHPDLTWTTYERGCLGTAYDGRNVNGLHIIARRDGDLWTAARWCGVELIADATAPTPDGVVALLLGTATVHAFRYVNHEDETRTVRVLSGTQSLTMEPTIYHPHDGPKVRAWDVDRSDWRVYDPARVVKP